jgi:hypothetical protein
MRIISFDIRGYIFAFIICLAATSCLGKNRSSVDSTRRDIRNETESKTCFDEDYPLDLEVILRVPLNKSITPESVEIEMEVRNNSRNTIEFCRYQTLLEGKLTNDFMLEVQDQNGNAVEYIGRVSKRKPPSRARGDYITLKPGEFIRVQIGPSHAAFSCNMTGLSRKSGNGAGCFC